MSLQSEVLAIMQERTTKQTKAKKLRELGITSYEINIMLSNIADSPRRRRSIQTEQTTQPPAIPAFSAADLSFGVEIECYNVNRQNLCTLAQRSGLIVRSESYNHTDNETYYKIVSDGSIYGNNGNEIVSPVLRGESGLQSLKTLCECLQFAGAKINKSTGLHIHLGLDGITDKHYYNIFYNYAVCYSAICKFLPNSRHDNSYCRKLTLLNYDYETYCRRNALTDIKQFICNTVYRSDRYRAVNPCSYLRHNTLEFRQHSGTVEYRKIFGWLSFIRALIDYSKDNLLEGEYNDPLALPFVASNAELKNYIVNRMRELNRNV